MRNIEFLPGTTINQLGTVERLHFTDLFEAYYVINENKFSVNDIQDEIFKSKEDLVNRLLILLDINPNIAFKFLTKIMLKTKNIPLINVLNSKHIELKSTLNGTDFNFNSYRDYNLIKRILKSFLFTYYTKKID